MKLAIFTLPLHTKYGGIIQAYALQTALERQGHEVVVMDRQPASFRRWPLWKAPFVYVRRIASKLPVDQRTVIDLEGTLRREIPCIRQHTDRFIRQWVHPRQLGSLADWRADEVEGIVVGSDQIWRIAYFGSWSQDLGNMFLAFARDWLVRL